MAKDPRTLKADAQKAVEKGKHKKALQCYLALEALEPRDGQWPRRAAECYRRLDKSGEELISLQRSVERYVRAGFLVKAIAVCKRILQIDPGHTATQQTIADLEAERGIPRVQRAASGTQAPAAIPEGTALGDMTLNQIMPARAVGGDAVRPSGIYEIPIELDDDDLIVEVDAEPSAGELAARAAAADVLPKTPLFSELDSGALASLIGDVELAELPPGAELFHQGAAADALYVVADGAVKAIDEGPPATTLGRIDEGEFFGEIGLLTRQPRGATIAAAEQGASLLRIPHAALDALIRNDPAVLTVLLRFLRDRLIDALVKTSPLFRPFGGADREALVSRFAFLELEAGAALVHQGAKAEGLFVMLSGRAQVMREHEGTSRRLATLEPGDLCGEMSLLTHQPAVATVRADSHGFAVMMPAAVFRETIMTHPHVLEQVGELAAQRERENAAIEGGGSDYTEGHIDLL